MMRLGDKRILPEDRYDLTVIMGSLGYPNLNDVVYSGGLDDVVEGISKYLPENIRVYVLAESIGNNEVEYKLKDNLTVYGIPCKHFEAGEEYEYVYKPYCGPIDQFAANSFDSKFIALKKKIPKIIEKSDGQNIIAHMHDWFSGPLGIELQQLGLPYIFQTHISVERIDYKKLFKTGDIQDWRLLYEKESCERADKVVVVSEESKDSIINAYKISPKKIIVIENAIDTNKFRPPTEEEKIKNREYLQRFKIKEPYIFWCGRYVREKGAKELIEAFNLFSRGNPEYSLLMAGFDGYEYPELVQIIKDLPDKVKEKISLADPNTYSDIVALNQNSSFAVYPSKVEAFGLMAVQSEACGKPVVVGNVGGLKKNVKEGCTGVHVDPNNIESILRGMEKVEDNKEEFGRNAREFAEKNYSWENRIIDYEKLYEEVASL